ncbi:hypothetical protein KZ774_16040 [Escherichia coli]|nr:hypothetical protein [Escherichia coli]
MRPYYYRQVRLSTGMSPVRVLLKNGTIRILENGALVNESSGTISSAIVVNEGGALTNEGVLNTVTLEGGTFNNNGTLNDVVKIEKKQQRGN